jgi:hypothetical protein
MVAKFKGKFMLKEYQMNLFRQLQNLRQKTMIVKEFIEEFHRLNIRAGHIEEDAKKVARYINALRYEIQDEISLLSLRNDEPTYQVDLKAEEKLIGKKSQRNKGRGPTRGKGQYNKGRFQPSKEEARISSN